MMLSIRKNYMPRSIKDAQGLLDYLYGTEDWSLIDEAIQRKAMDLGRELTLQEKAIMVNSLLRGYRRSNYSNGAIPSRINIRKF